MLELVKMRRILIVDDDENGNADENVMFSINPENEGEKIELDSYSLPS